MQPSGAQCVVGEVENPFGVEGLVLEAYFEVQVRSGGASGAAAKSDDVAGIDHLSWLDKYFGQVPVDCLQAVFVAHDDQVAVAAHRPGNAHHPRETGTDGVAGAEQDVDAPVWPLPSVAPSVGRRDDVLHREAEVAAVFEQAYVHFVGKRVER